MKFADFFANPRRQEEDAAVIFDRSEPIGRPTDLVLPYRPFLDRFRGKKTAALSVAAPNES